MSAILNEINSKLTSIINYLNNLDSNSKTTEELDQLNPFQRNALLRSSFGGVSKKFSIQDLIDDISSELVLGNVPAKFLSIAIDFDAAGTTHSKVISAINLLPNNVLDQGTLYFFHTNRIVLTNGIGIGTGNGVTYAVIQEIFVLTQRITPDVNGVSSIGVSGTPLLSSGIRFLTTNDTRSFEPIEFDLGDIGTDAINDFVNANGNYSTPNAATVIFKATQGGTDKIWLYVGVHEEIGVGFSQTALTDFRLFPDANNTDPVPPYQESNPETIVQTGTDYKMKNTHCDFYFMDAPTNTTTVNLVEVGNVGSHMRIRYDFTQLSAYPTVTTSISGLNIVFIDDLNDFSGLDSGKYDMFCEYDGEQVNYFFRFISI